MSNLVPGAGDRILSKINHTYGAVEETAAQVNKSILPKSSS